MDEGSGCGRSSWTYFEGVGGTYMLATAAVSQRVPLGSVCAGDG